MFIRLTYGADGRIGNPSITNHSRHSLITNNRSLITRHDMLIRLTSGTDGRIGNPSITNHSRHSLITDNRYTDNLLRHVHPSDLRY